MTIFIKTHDINNVSHVQQNLFPGAIIVMKRTRYLQRILSSHSDPATMGKLVACLVRSNKFSEAERLLQCLPNAKEYNNNEDITRARIAVAWHKKDVGKVFKLIEVNS